jgi:hypothetical protein
MKLATIIGLAVLGLLVGLKGSTDLVFGYLLGSLATVVTYSIFLMRD